MIINDHNFESYQYLNLASYLGKCKYCNLICQLDFYYSENKYKMTEENILCISDEEKIIKDILE